MLLNSHKVVLVLFEEGVVKGITEVSLAAVDVRNKIGESFDVPPFVFCADKGDEITQEIGDGDDLIAFVGTDDAGFAPRVHAGGDAGEIFEAGFK